MFSRELLVGGMDWYPSVGRGSVGKSMWVMSTHPTATYTCGVFSGARPEILYY